MYNLWIMILFLLSATVFQNGDTLFFMKDSVHFDTLVMQEHVIERAEPVRVKERAKVGPINTIYLVHSATYSLTVPESLTGSAIVFYDAEKNVLLEDFGDGGRYISYELSDVLDSLLVVTAWDSRFGKPSLYVVKEKEKVEIIKQGDWDRIVSYKVSPNNRYFLFHMRSPYQDKPWDYIYFYDLMTAKDWDYLFPSCLSCKKSRIYLEVDNGGRAEVIHKNEHRVFTPDGILTDIYLSPH